MKATRPPARGLTLFEVLVLALLLLVLLGAGLPMIKAATCDALKNVSIRNLQVLNAAHAVYAADWDDRQFTLVRDDLSQYGNNSLYACQGLIDAGECHPPVILGEDCEGVLHGFFFGCGGQAGGCDQIYAAVPMNFPEFVPGNPDIYAFGSFRIPNARGFNQYVNGRFFDPVFYAPKDAPIYETVRPLFDVNCEFAGVGTDLAFSSSYALSPAAMFHPEVFSDKYNQGLYWRSPFSFPEGFQSPTVSQAKYAALKTRMIEHNWLQNPPEPCNQAFLDCVPYFFNHGHNSFPITLFFDGHIDSLSPFEAIRAESRVLAQTDGDQPLWSRDTSLGSDGYFTSDGWDFVQTSYHILTVDGIRGRDTVAPP